MDEQVDVDDDRESKPTLEMAIEVIGLHLEALAQEDGAEARLELKRIAHLLLGRVKAIESLAA